MTRRRQEAQRKARNLTLSHQRGASNLQLAMLIGALAVVGISFANQRQVSRMDERLDTRLDRVEARLQAVPAAPASAPLGTSTPGVPAADPGTANTEVTAADANPTVSALVGVKPVGSKMPDAVQIYDFAIAQSPAKGPSGAPITIVEFSDFECSFCRKAQPTLARIEEVYGDQVRLVWKHLPISIHKNAPLAHLASVAAANQGKFWQYRDLLFANPGKIGPDDLRQYALEVGLKMQQFEEDLTADATRQAVEADMTEAVAIDLTATPGFFINGRYIRGAKPFEDFTLVIDEELVKLGLPIPEAVTIEAESGTDPMREEQEGG